MDELEQRQWESRYLVRIESWDKERCQICKKPLQEWKGAYYGVFSDCCSLFDFEYSHYTGYCKECARTEAKKSRESYHFVCPPVVQHIDNIKDGRFYCERKVYADGSIVESTEDSMRYAERVGR